MAVAELDPALITKRKRMLDSVGHYARPDIFTLLIDRRARANVRTNVGAPPVETEEEITAEIEHQYVSRLPIGASH
jgi:aliphatic nitrilase